MPIDINYSNGFQPSSFIDSVNPSPNSTGVDTDSTFEVILKVTPNMDSIISSNFRLELSDTGERFEFNTINYTVDWFPLQKKLILHLNRALNSSEDYTFIIENLYDAAGNEMDSPFVMSFRTSDVQKVVSEEVDTTNLLVAEDRTIANNDIVPYVAPVTPSDVTVSSTDPTNASYNITGTSIGDTINIVFNLINPNNTSAPDEYKSYVKFERKLISVGETSWEAFPDEWHVYHEAVNPEAGFAIANYDENWDVQPLDLGDGYEYRITISKNLPFSGVDGNVYMAEDFVLMFISNLPDMLTSVNSVLMYYPAYEPYDVAKQIYINSQMVSLMNPTAGATNVAAVNYVKYATLYQCGSLTEGIATHIVLGDLEVEAPDGTLLERWEELMHKAEQALMRKKPAWAVKGENWPSSHQSTRNWDV